MGCGGVHGLQGSAAHVVVFPFFFFPSAAQVEEAIQARFKQAFPRRRRQGEALTTTKERVQEVRAALLIQKFFRESLARRRMQLAEHSLALRPGACETVC